MMLRSISTVKILLIAITALVFGAGNLLAESPAKPEFFSITPVMGNNSIYLMAGWTESQGDEPEGFKIYFSVGMKKEYDGFLLYKDIDNMQDTLLRKFENNYAYLLNSELKKGTYSFYITAYNKDGESENSEICYMEIKDMEFPDDYITFTSVPVTEAAIGEKYEFNMDAKAKSGKDIEYSLVEKPDGMVIDENSGLITWTPQESGFYLVVVTATLTDNKDIHNELYWRINVRSCKEKTVIKGLIRNKKDGKPVDKALVNIYSSETNNVDSYTMVEAVNGEFSADVDEGSYYIYVGGNFQPVYYKDALTPDDAEIVTVACGETKEIEMEVEPFKEYPKYMVSGRVTDANGNPIEKAFISFDIVSGNVYYGGDYLEAFTDEKGGYSLELTSGNKYIARCLALTGDTTTKLVFPFQIQYYDGVSDPMEAEIIELPGDRDDINFVMKETPKYNNSITGAVVDENKAPIEKAYVMAYLAEPNPDVTTQSSGRFTETDQDGKFKIENLIPGKYVLVVLPNSDSYEAGLYKENSFVVQKWEDATKVEVQEEGSSGDYTIKLPLLKMVKGTGGIKGFVTSLDYTTNTKGNKPLESNPMNGAMVYALDESGNVVNYTRTNQDGEFEINGLSVGTYTVLADKVGYKNDKSMAVIGENGGYSENYLQLTKGSPTDVEDGNSNFGSELQVYPNPADKYLNLTLKAEGRVTVNLYNAEGVKVMTKIISGGMGVINTQIGTQSLPAGLYYLQAEGAAGTFTAKFIISR